MTRGQRFSQTSQVASRSAAARAVASSKFAEAASLATPESAASFARQERTRRKHSFCGKSRSQSPTSNSGAVGEGENPVTERSSSVQIIRVHRVTRVLLGAVNARPDVASRPDVSAPRHTPHTPVAQSILNAFGEAA